MPPKKHKSDSGQAKQIVRNRKKKLTRQAVLKMLAVMEASQSASSTTNSNPSTEEGAMESDQDFLSSGRTGRRNALPDILEAHSYVSSSDLPSKLEALTTKDKTESTSQPQPSTSGASSADFR